MLTSGTWHRRGGTIILDLESASTSEGFVETELESGRATLRQGSRGSEVATLQSRLAALGFQPGPADGIFGSLTTSAVRAFQSSRGLSVDGIVGPQTWTALYAQGSTGPSRPTTPPPSQWGARPAIHIHVPFYGYKSNDPAGCFRRCTEMAAAVGVRVGGPDVRIQVATREDARGGITIDPAKAREGMQYIDAQLAAGQPVVVGVSYMDDDYNVDKITDHFVIITGRGTDANQRRYYTYHDPARSSASIGGDTNVANRFYMASDGGLSRPSSASAPMADKTYSVSMVRRNL